MPTDNPIDGLPGEDLIREGLADLESGRRTIPACLVEIARSRLSRGDPAEPAFLLQCGVESANK
jgi:hypothetical protein